MIASPPEDIGSILKERRQELGLTLQEAAERTRIRKVYLENIESNHLEKLPGKTYITGFIGVYSRYLGLDSKALLESLQVASVPDTSYAGATPLPEKFDKHLLKAAKAKKARRAFLLVLLAIAVAGAAIVFFSVSEQDQQVIATVTPQRPEPTTLPAKPEAVKPMVDVVSAPAVEEQKEEALKQPDDVAGAKARLPSVSPDGSALRMLALDKGSLIINVDKRKPITYVLHNGLDLTWKIKEQVALEIAPVDTASFWLDGQKLDIAGLAKISLQTAAEEE